MLKHVYTPNSVGICIHRAESQIALGVKLSVPCLQSAEHVTHVTAHTE